MDRFDGGMNSILVLFSPTLLFLKLFDMVVKLVQVLPVLLELLLELPETTIRLVS